MARDPYDDRWYRDFTTRILPVEWKVAKRSKQKGFVEPLGVAALCFTDVVTGDTFKLFDFTLASCNKKEVNICGIADCGIQTTVSIFARYQNHDHLMVLLNCLQPNNSDMCSKERVPATTLPTDSTSRKFLNHYLTKAATALDARPSSNIPGVDRDRFLAVMRLITRRSANSSKADKHNILSSANTEIGADVNTASSQEKEEYEAIKRAMSLPFKIEAHKKLLVELGVCNNFSDSNDPKMTNIQKLQAGILDVHHKETLLELRKVYKPAYMLYGTVDSNQGNKCYTQRLGAIVDDARSLCDIPSNRDNNGETTHEHEVVRSSTCPCGLIDLSDIRAAHSTQRRSAGEGKSRLDTNHVPGSAKFLRRPIISAFNATVEDIPDLTTPL